jgi:hypothetical protein
MLVFLAFLDFRLVGFVIACDAKIRCRGKPNRRKMCFLLPTALNCSAHAVARDDSTGRYFSALEVAFS